MLIYLPIFYYDVITLLNLLLYNGLSEPPIYILQSDPRTGLYSEMP